MLTVVTMPKPQAQAQQAQQQESERLKAAQANPSQPPKKRNFR